MLDNIYTVNDEKEFLEELVETFFRAKILDLQVFLFKEKIKNFNKIKQKYYTKEINFVIFFKKKNYICIIVFIEKNYIYSHYTYNNYKEIYDYIQKNIIYFIDKKNICLCWNSQFAVSPLLDFYIDNSTELWESFKYNNIEIYEEIEIQIIEKFNRKIKLLENNSNIIKLDFFYKKNFLNQ